ncbi:MAG: hypothetical protein IM613_12155 [Cytophagales bacterium]|nr:hypothetical protein [Cytophagales bacterium]
MKWRAITDDWTVPREIYYAIDADDLDTAQEMLDHQASIWGRDDMEVIRAQMFIDMAHINTEYTDDERR